MTILSQESFAAARAYIMTHGRPLDQARFAYHFEDGDPASILRELAAYQNEDGGFGKALEPDLRTPASSAIATATGLTLLREAGAKGDDPLAIAAVRYLLNSYDARNKVWPIVPPAVEDAPHAPWWSYAESATTFAGFRINPRAALVGHLYHFASGQGAAADLLSDVSQSLLAHIESIADEEMGMHDLLATLELAETDDVPAEVRSPIVDKLRRVVPSAIVTDPEQWTDYVLRPLQVAPAPDSLMAPFIDRQAIDVNLDYEIEQQSADGSWALAWSWDFIDAAAWAQAEKEWKGFHAVNHLRVLAAYDRIADA
jgi:hypothetical protein